MQTFNDTHWESEFIDSPNAGLHLGITQVRAPAAWRALICHVAHRNALQQERCTEKPCYILLRLKTRQHCWAAAFMLWFQFVCSAPCSAAGVSQAVVTFPVNISKSFVKVNSEKVRQVKKVRKVTELKLFLSLWKDLPCTLQNCNRCTS